MRWRRCVLLLVVPAAPVYAGSWVPVNAPPPAGYSGTTVCANSAGGKSSGIWPFAPPGIGTNPGGSAEASTSGSITRTLRWEEDPGIPGDEQPPACVLVEEEAVSGWSAKAYIPPFNTPASLYMDACSGSAANGLRARPGDYTESATTSDAGGRRRTRRFRIVDGSSGTITGTCSLSSTVHASARPAPSTACVYVSVSVNYTLAAHNVEVSLGGVTPDDAGNDHILIGQVCKAGLSRPADLLYDSFSWTVAGDTFDHFERGADDETGEALPVPSEEWRSPSPDWCWRSIASQDWNKQESASVAGEADAYFEGERIGRVKAKREVTVWRPYYGLFNQDRGIPYFTRPRAGGTLRSGDSQGVGFDGAVGTPAFFRERLGSAGSAYWINLVKREHHLRPRLLVVADDASTNNEFWLDNEVPYMKLRVPATSTERRHSWVSFSDTPETAGLLRRLWVSVDDRFQSYLMYEPPDGGLGVQPVPVYRVDWMFAGTGKRDRVGLVGRGRWRFEPPGGITAITLFGLYNGHPRWGHRYRNPGE